MARGRQPLQPHGAGLGIASHRGTGRRSQRRPLGGAGAQRALNKKRPPPPPLVSSALGRSGLLRAARAGPLRGGGASAGAPDGRAPKTTARGGACARGQGRGDAEQAGADGDGARRLTWLGP